MKKSILVLILISSLLNASCFSGYTKELPMISFSKNKDNKKVPSYIYCPNKPSDDKCISLNFTAIEDGEPFCIYYKLDIDKANTFNAKLKKANYLKNLDTTLNIYNSKLDISNTQKNEYLSKEIIKIKTKEKSSDILQYFPGYSEEKFTNDLIKKISSPIAVSSKFKTRITTKKDLCSKCSQENTAPSIGINNILKDIKKEIVGLQDDIKQMASNSVDELSSTLYDLTSDEAVIYYYIVGVSYVAASASCSFKSYIIDPKDVMSLSKAAVTATQTKGTVTKDTTDSKTKQSVKVKNKNCYFAIQNKCILGNYISGVEKGVRQKTISTGSDTTKAETKAALNTANEIAYDECMKTEPNKIRDRITKFLKNNLNGVKIDLFATKQCSDEYAKKKWGLGLVKNSEKDNSKQKLILNKIMNFTISYLDTQRHNAAGFINRTEESFFNQTDNNTSLKNIDKDFQQKIQNLKNFNTKYLDLKPFLKNEFIINKDLSIPLENLLNQEINDLSIIYYEYNNYKNIIFNLINKIKDNKNLSFSDSNIIVNMLYQSLKELQGDINNLAIQTSLNTKNSIYKSIGCTKYKATGECTNVGLRPRLFSNLDNAFSNYININFYKKYPLLNNKNLEDIQDFVFNEILIQGDISKIKNANNFQIYIDFLKTQTFKRISNDFSMFELNLNRYLIYTHDKERKKGIQLTKNILISVAK